MVHNFPPKKLLSPVGDGTWTEKVLHSFSGSDGSGPYATPVFDTAGNLYVTTLGGGANGWGTVGMLTPGVSWTENVLYSFMGGSDGGTPESSLVLDATGNLYGTTYTNSSGTGFGTAFELINSNSGCPVARKIRRLQAPTSLIRTPTSALVGMPPLWPLNRSRANLPPSRH